MFLTEAALAHRWAVQDTSARRVAFWFACMLGPVRGSRWILIALGALCVVASGAVVAYPLTGLSVGICVWALLRAWAYVRLYLGSPAQRPWRLCVAVACVALAVWTVVGAPLWAGWVVAAALLLDVATRLLSFRTAFVHSRTWSIGVVALFLCAAISAVVWPDLAWVGIAYIFGLALLRTAVWLVRSAFMGVPSATELPWRSAPLLPNTTPSVQWDLLPPSSHTPGSFTPRGLKAIAGGVAFIVAGAAMVTGTAVLSSTNNTVDSFYSYWSEDIPAPGTLLKSDDYDGPHPAELTVKRILFSSTDSTGEPTIASGIIALPTSYIESGSTAPLPLILWEHGTNGLESMCSLSAGPAALDPQAFPAVDGIVEKQWAIVAPDFMTHTQPNRSPYLVGQGQAQFALDAARAARSMSAAQIMGTLEGYSQESNTQNLNFTRETVVWGHSQGGNAALWTAQLASTYAPEIQIAGTAALSPAALPLELGLRLTSESASAAVGIVVSYVLGAYSAAYQDVDPNDYVAHNALPIYAGFKSRCTNAAAAGSLVTALALQKQSNDVFHNFGADTALGKRLASNEPTGPFPSPLFVGWGSKDEVIDSTLQNTYVERLCASDIALTAHEYPERTHMDVLQSDSQLPTDLIDWTSSLFSGTTPPGNTCGR